MSNEPEAPASKGAGVNLEVDGKNLLFTQREASVGQTLYYVLVITIIVIVLGAAWTILDVIMPTGKWEWFVAQPYGVQFAIIGAGLFGLFMLIILFYMLYKGGTHSITKALFSAKKVYREMKTTGFARVVTGGIMISIFLVAGGVVLFLIQFVASNGSISGWSLQLDSLGKWVLFIGILAVAFTSMVIAFAFFWNAGNILLTRKFFGQKKA